MNENYEQIYLILSVTLKILKLILSFSEEDFVAINI